MSISSLIHRVSGLLWTTLPSSLTSWGRGKHVSSGAAHVWDAEREKVQFLQLGQIHHRGQHSPLGLASPMCRVTQWHQDEPALLCPPQTATLKVFFSNQIIQQQWMHTYHRNPPLVPLGQLGTTKCKALFYWQIPDIKFRVLWLPVVPVLAEWINGSVFRRSGWPADSKPLPRSN